MVNTSRAALVQEKEQKLWDYKGYPDSMKKYLRAYAMKLQECQEPNFQYSRIVPKQHWMENHTTYTQCDAAHPDVYDHVPDRSTFTGGVQGEKLPAGTPFTLYDINSVINSTISYASSSTFVSDLHSKNKKELYRNYLPLLYKSVSKKSFPNGAIMKVKEGKKLVPVVCKETTYNVFSILFPEEKHECGGIYRASDKGYYSCVECGIIYTWNFYQDDIKKTDAWTLIQELEAEEGNYEHYDLVEQNGKDIDSFEYDADFAEDMEAINPIGNHTSKFLLGGKLPPKMQAIENRLNKNEKEWLETPNREVTVWPEFVSENGRAYPERTWMSESWRDMISEASEDEVKAHEKLLEKKAEHKKVKKESSRGTRRVQDDLYKTKEKATKKELRKAAILTYLKDGLTRSSDIYKAILASGVKFNRDVFSKLLDELVVEGRISFVKQEIKGDGKSDNTRLPKVITLLR